jgi:DNA-binding GntR family transcriptional regulator
VLSVEDREFERPQDLLAEHRAILKAIESGDADQAVEQVRTHVVRNGHRVLEILRGMGDPPKG